MYENFHSFKIGSRLEFVVPSSKKKKTKKTRFNYAKKHEKFDSNKILKASNKLEKKLSILFDFFPLIKGGKNFNLYYRRTEKREYIKN